MDVCAVRRISICLDSAWVESAGRGGASVLLVTPDSDLRAAARRALEQWGYHVAEAAHSGHALLACMSDRTVDIAVVEAALEDMPGSALVEKLRRQQPGLRALYLGQAGAAPRADTIARPLTSDRLRDRLDALTSAPAF